MPAGVDAANLILQNLYRIIIGRSEACLGNQRKGIPFE